MSASRFHLSLNVGDLAATAAFLEQLLGTAPVQLHADFARFELLDPPLVLLLVPADTPGVDHVGFRLPNRAALDALRQRLTSAGIRHECEDSTVCSQPRQAKLWAHDPAGNLWELHVLEEAASGAIEPMPPTPHRAKLSAAGTASATYAVVYRGPFVEVRDEAGLVFRRGETTCVDAPTWQRLQASTAAAQFAFSPAESPGPPRQS